MSIASGKSHPTYLYNLCGHVLSSVKIAKYLGITLTDELSWSSHVHSIHSCANSTLGFLRRNLRRCPAKLKETAHITLVRSTLEYAASIRILIWPRIVTCLRSYSSVLRGLLKGITGQHPVCPRCCMILAGVTLKTAGETLDWLCCTRLSLGMWPLIQIRLVWWLRTTGPEQITDTNSGQ